MIAENTLLTLGINTNEHKRKLTFSERTRELEQNLRAYTNEVLADRPVSILYHYYPDSQQRLFSDPSLKPVFLVENQFDDQERDGLPKQGFIKSTQLLLENPGKIVFWYSPSGDASFDSNPDNPYNSIKYNYGQLYFQYFDGEQVNALALKVTNPKVLKYFSPELLKNLNYDSDQENKIKNSLLNPVLANLSLDDFFNQEFDDMGFYKEHRLPEIIQEMKASLAGKAIDFSKFEIPEKLTFRMTKELILQIYVSTIKRYMEVNNKQQISLSGSCGGSTITRNDIEQLLGINEFDFTSSIDKLLSPYGSESRRLNQSEKKWEYHEGECVVCHNKPTRVGPCNICQECEKKFD